MDYQLFLQREVFNLPVEHLKKYEKLTRNIAGKEGNTDEIRHKVHQGATIILLDF